MLWLKQAHPPHRPGGGRFDVWNCLNLNNYFDDVLFLFLFLVGRFWIGLGWVEAIVVLFGRPVCVVCGAQGLI